MARARNLKPSFFLNTDLAVSHDTSCLPKEIKDSLFQVAAEILSYLTGRTVENLIDYNYIPEPD